MNAITKEILEILDEDYISIAVYDNVCEILDYIKEKLKKYKDIIGGYPLTEITSCVNTWLSNHREYCDMSIDENDISLVFLENALNGFDDDKY